MAYVAGFEDFGAREEQSSTSARAPSDWFARIGAVLGAGVVGVVAGFVATISLGRLDTWIGAAFAGQVYLAALYLAGHAELDTVKRRAWLSTALIALHIVAMIGWPVALFLLKTNVPAYWLPLPAMATSLLVLAALAPRTLWRVGAVALLVTALAANQATLFLMGA